LKHSLPLTCHSKQDQQGVKFVSVKKKNTYEADIVMAKLNFQQTILSSTFRAKQFCF